MHGGGDQRQQREQKILDRIKELDHAHRNRLAATGAGQALSLHYLRCVIRQWLRKPRIVPVKPIARPDDGAVVVSPIGHGTVAIVTPQARVLTDPFLTRFLYGLRRAVTVPLHPEDLEQTSCVLISHGRRDRLHPESLRKVPKTTLVIAPPGLEGKLSRLGFDDIVTLAPEESYRHADLVVTAVPARHDGGGGGLTSNGYVLQTDEVAIYAAGDTGYFSGFADIGRRFRPDLVLLPIGGYAPYPLRAHHMSPLDAVYALEDLQARVLVPVAYGVVPLGYESLDEPLRWLRAACESQGLTGKLAALGPGERLTLRRRPIAN